MKTEEMIAVMQAWIAAGKPALQFRCDDGVSCWTDLSCAPGCWDTMYTYRIKPREPREWWVQERLVLQNKSYLFPCKNEPEVMRANGWVRVREVIE